MKVLAIGLVLFAGTSFGATLKDKKAYADHDKKFQAEVESANKACGTKITGKIDWASFEKGKADVHTMSVGEGYCGDGIGGVRNLCSDETAKTAIAKNVKSIVCKFGGKGKRDLKISGGQITWTIDFDASNNGDFAKEQIENSPSLTK